MRVYTVLRVLSFHPGVMMDKGRWSSGQSLSVPSLSLNAVRSSFFPPPLPPCPRPTELILIKASMREMRCLLLNKTRTIEMTSPFERAEPGLDWVGYALTARRVHCLAFWLSVISEIPLRLGKSPSWDLM